MTIIIIIKTGWPSQYIRLDTNIKINQGFSISFVAVCPGSSKLNWVSCL